MSTKRKRLVPAALVLLAVVLCGTISVLAPKKLYERGKRCADGEGAEQNWEEAAKWYYAAAKLGYSQAQFAYGECCYDGNGVEQDYGQSVYWLRKSAAQDNSDAQCGLGACYLTGVGVQQTLSRQYTGSENLQNRIILMRSTFWNAVTSTAPVSKRTKNKR